MTRNLITVAIIGLFVFVSATNAQDKIVGKEIETKVQKKTNQRPEKKEEKAEPFDKADVKTMAAQCVTLETEKGNILLELFPESAAETVRNFLNLTAIGAFDNTTFSRVVPNFIIQGGNLWTNEDVSVEIKWRSKETIPDEPNPIKHESEILSMARPDKPNGASTNFFILLREASYLDGKFAAFGRVISGMETVKTINELPVEDEKPKEPVRIKTAKVAVCPTTK